MVYVLHYLFFFLLLLWLSQDCMEWKMLPHVDETLHVKSTLLHGRFTGDPSFIVEHKVTNRVGMGEDAAEKTTNVRIIITKIETV